MTNQTGSSDLFPVLFHLMRLAVGGAALMVVAHLGLTPPVFVRICEQVRVPQWLFFALESRVNRYNWCPLMFC